MYQINKLSLDQSSPNPSESYKRLPALIQKPTVNRYANCNLQKTTDSL